jgi:hypothetical protein
MRPYLAGRGLRVAGVAGCRPESRRRCGHPRCPELTSLLPVRHRGFSPPGFSPPGFVRDETRDDDGREGHASANSEDGRLRGRSLRQAPAGRHPLACRHPGYPRRPCWRQTCLANSLRRRHPPLPAPQLVAGATARVRGRCRCTRRAACPFESRHSRHTVLSTLPPIPASCPVLPELLVSGLDRLPPPFLPSLLAPTMSRSAAMRGVVEAFQRVETALAAARPAHGWSPEALSRLREGLLGVSSPDGAAAAGGGGRGASSVRGADKRDAGGEGVGFSLQK